jgi:threonine/homoserine/homoserine lactone efflux protein
MVPSTVAAFWGVSFLLVLTPGADWAYMITAGLRNRVLSALLGLLIGYLLITTVVAAGVGALVTRLPVLLTVLTLAGAAYLVWLGATALARPPVPGVFEGTATGSPTRWTLKGIGVSGLNPKAFLLFLALLPQFTQPGTGWPLAVQIAALGGIHMLSSTLVYLGVGTGARRVLGTRPAAARIVSRVSGSVMIGIGLFLLVEQLISR